MQRVHWDPEFARRSGNPTTFDYGRMRETWLIHLCTDWMGDDAWLWKLDCEFRRFNYVGDTQWLRGRVVRKFLAAGDRPAVDLELEAVNQRGEVTTPGPRDDPAAEPRARPVRLPDPPGGATRPAGRARRDLRGVLPPMSDALGTTPVDGLAVGSTTAAAAHARPAREAQRDRRRDDARARRRARRPRRPTTRVRVDPARGRGRALLRRRRHRRPQPQGSATPRSRAPAASSAGCPTQAHRLIPLLARRAGPGGVQGARVGRPGIGFQLALAADFTIAADDARFWEPFARARVHARQRRDVAVAAPGRRGAGARAAAARPRALAAPRPPEWGAIHRAVPGAELDAAVDELVGQLATGPTVALGLTKWLLHAGRERRLEQHLRNEAFALELSSRTDDFREGIAAFREKRAPRFEGR